MTRSFAMAVRGTGLLLALSLSGCSTPMTPPVDAGCDVMFGRPVEGRTGLNSTQCGPSCTCNNKKVDSLEFTQARFDELLSWQLETPLAELTSNPYDAPVPKRDEGVCAMVVTDKAAKKYKLQTFATVEEVTAAGATLTHHDACGVCSTLQDFVVYAKDPDLGAPVRKCGVDTFAKGFEEDVKCLQALGFTRPCAQIWAYNTQNTRGACFEPCLRINEFPYHLPDGRLNECLQCDENKSGPIFKAVGGRTRRNTGVASSICRPCGEARPVSHAYP